jgi:hypothetical protein
MGILLASPAAIAGRRLKSSPRRPMLAPKPIFAEALFGTRSGDASTRTDRLTARRTYRIARPVPKPMRPVLKPSASQKPHISHPSLRGALATKQSTVRRDGLPREACHRARIRATRWLALTHSNTHFANNFVDQWRDWWVSQELYPPYGTRLL